MIGFISLFLLLILQGFAVTLPTSTLSIIPDQTFYRPGATVTLRIVDAPGVRLQADITYRDQIVTTLEIPLLDDAATLTWQPPPDAPRGYGVDVRVYGEDDALVASATTAFDVLERWTDAPRYGFYSDFSAGRANDDATRDWLLRHHINGVQFYDWQYRWENLLPEDALFDDGLGRPQSMATIRRLIDLTQEVGAAAIPYTAIYGVSIAFHRQHPDWALVNATGEPYLFGENFMAIFDPTLGSPWNTHLLAEYADVLANTTFDGIHIDQYGSPKNGFNTRGEPVDLAEVMSAFIDQTAALVAQMRGDAGSVIFNCVGNWPVEAVAPADQDAVYIEVWAPHNDYADLNRLIIHAQEWGDDKPVILASYIPPELTTNWRLANAVIFASGGSHIETGEPGAMLADPYFPNFGQIAAQDQAVFSRYYDFMVRYENLLSVGTSAAPEARHRIDMGDIRTRSIRARDRVVPIVRQGPDFETFNLVNFVNVRQTDWNQPDTETPTPLVNVPIRIPVERPVAQVWVASPDQSETMRGQALSFAAGGGTLSLTLPRLDYWTMIVVEYAA